MRLHPSKALRVSEGGRCWLGECRQGDVKGALGPFFILSHSQAYPEESWGRAHHLEQVHGGPREIWKQIQKVPQLVVSTHSMQKPEQDRYFTIELPHPHIHLLFGGYSGIYHTESLSTHVHSSLSARFLELVCNLCAAVSIQVSPLTTILLFCDVT